MYRIILLTFWISVQNSNGARILGVFPTPSISHQIVFRPLTQELTKRGHDVTVITPDPAFDDQNRPANLTEIDVHDISYQIFLAGMQNENVMEFGDRSSIFKVIEGMTTFFGIILEEQVKTGAVQKLINDKSNKYDLIIVEACARPAILFSHLYKAPVIVISSFGMAFGGEDMVGAPSHPILYPVMMQQRLHNLTFWEKIYEFYKYFWILNTWKSTESKELNSIKKYFGDNVPSYDELYKNVDMVFLNLHPMWNHNRPFPPNVISIWGIHKNPPKSLPQDLQAYLDSSKNGVIYVSFGTNALSTMLPMEKVQILINVFSKLPYNILWKWETEELPGKSKNIKIAKWLPQSDLLRHPNIKLFITQGGLQSTDEAMNAGVPLLGIPMFGDQWYNVESYEHHKIGIRIELDTITEEKLTKGIETAINDKSYKENIIRLNRLMNDQPQSALDNAVWWTEYILRNGGAKHLRAAGAYLSWAEYYEIEFLLKLVSLVLLIAVIVLSLVYRVYRIIVPSNLPSNKFKTS